MAARRCSLCSITYPPDISYKDCKVCGEPTSWFSDLKPDEDWQETVARNTAPEMSFEDKAERWRYDRLVAAGMSEGSALELAARRDIDLHEAVEITSKAGPELAYRILS